MTAPKTYSHIKRLSTGELEILIRLLKTRLASKEITVAESRLLLRAVATKAAAGDVAAVRLRRTIYRVNKLQRNTSAGLH